MENLLLPALMVLAVGGMFLMSRRNRQQQAKQTEFRDTLESGQQVMTSSGQLGTVVEVVGDAVTIETTPGVHTRWVKAAITSVPPQFASVLEPEADEDEDEDYEYDVEDFEDVSEDSDEDESGETEDESGETAQDRPDRG